MSIQGRKGKAAKVLGMCVLIESTGSEQVELWAYACLMSTGCLRNGKAPARKMLASLPTCLDMRCKQSRRNLVPTPSFSFSLLIFEPWNVLNLKQRYL